MATLLTLLETPFEGESCVPPEGVLKTEVLSAELVARREPGVFESGMAERLAQRLSAAGGPVKRLRGAGTVGIGGRYRIRTYDFHRVKMALYR
jgi:hypothetical protein